MLTARRRPEGEWQDWLVDPSADQESTLGDCRELDVRRGLLRQAMVHLSERERHILTERRLREQPLRLDELASQYGVSRERIRQIEERAFHKLQKAMGVMPHRANTLLQKLEQRSDQPHITQIRSAAARPSVPEQQNWAVLPQVYPGAAVLATRTGSCDFHGPFMPKAGDGQGLRRIG